MRRRIFEELGIQNDIDLQDEVIHAVEPIWGLYANRALANNSSVHRMSTNFTVRNGMTEALAREYQNMPPVVRERFALNHQRARLGELLYDLVGSYWQWFRSRFVPEDPRFTIEDVRGPRRPGTWKQGQVPALEGPTQTTEPGAQEGATDPQAGPGIAPFDPANNAAQVGQSDPETFFPGPFDWTRASVVPDADIHVVRSDRIDNVITIRLSDMLGNRNNTANRSADGDWVNAAAIDLEILRNNLFQAGLLAEGDRLWWSQIDFHGRITMALDIPQMGEILLLPMNVASTVERSVATMWPTHRFPSPDPYGQSSRSPLPRPSFTIIIRPGDVVGMYHPSSREQEVRDR